MYFAIVIKVLEVYLVLFIFIHLGNRFLSAHPFVHPLGPMIYRLALLPDHAKGLVNGRQGLFRSLALLNFGHVSLEGNHFADQSPKFRLWKHLWNDGLSPYQFSHLELGLSLP